MIPRRATSPTAVTCRPTTRSRAERPLRRRRQDQARGGLLLRQEGHVCPPGEPRVNRRRFLALLGLAPVAAAVAPVLAQPPAPSLPPAGYVDLCQSAYTPKSEALEALAEEMGHRAALKLDQVVYNRGIPVALK